jgi:MFS family permease
MNKNLGLLLSGQLVSQVGDKFYLLALSFWVLKTTGSPALMGIVLAASLFPSLILGFFSGAFIDRYDRKKIIVGTDVIRGVIIGGVAAAYYLGMLNFTLIVVSQVLLSICAAFFDPTIPVIIPKMAPADQLSKANSMTQFIRGMSTIIGPVLGGVAVAALGYGFAFAINGVSYLVSAFFELFLKIPPVEKTAGAAPSLKSEIIEGYKYILLDRGLLIILAMVGVIHFFVGSIEVIIPVLADLLPGEGARNLGYIQTAFGVGAVVMAFIISIHNIAKKEVRFLFGSVFLVGAGYVSVAVLLLSGIFIVVPFLLIFLLTGSFIILAGTCFRTILQTGIDDRMAGRVFGVVSSVGNGSIPFAMMVYGFLLTVVPVHHLVLVSGLLLLPLSIIFYKQYNKQYNSVSAPRTGVSYDG